MEFFCLRYEIDSQDTISPVPSNCYLPFPCSYRGIFPALYASYCLNVHKAIQQVKESVTRMLCRTSQAHGRSYIRTSRTINSSNDFWSYLKYSCPDVEVHGPFQRKRKCLKMRSHMDLCSVSESSSVYIMRFETITHFCRYDFIFGSYSRYGTTEPHPSIDETTVMRGYHHVATMGSGTTSQSRKFYRKSIPTLGVDFVYNIDRHNLQISVRYQIVKVSTDQSLNQFILNRDQVTSTSKRDR